MGAEFCNVHPGDVVAVWGCGGVGLMAQDGIDLGAARSEDVILASQRFGEPPEATAPTARTWTAPTAAGARV